MSHQPTTSQVPVVRKLEQERLPPNPHAATTSRPIREDARRTYAAVLARSLKERRNRA